MEEKKHYVLEIQNIAQENVGDVKDKNSLEEALLRLDEEFEKLSGKE